MTGTGGTECGRGAEKDRIGSPFGPAKFMCPKPAFELARGVPMPLALGVAELFTEGGVEAAAFQFPGSSCLFTKDGVGIAGDIIPDGGKGTGGVGAGVTSRKRPGVLGVGPIGGGTLCGGGAIPASLLLALVVRALCTAATAAAAVASASTKVRMLGGRRAPTAATSSSNTSKRAKRSVRSMSRSDAILDPCEPLR